MTMTEILLAHKEGKMTDAEANKALAEIGCDLTVDSADVDGGWTEEELDNGFSSEWVRRPVQQKLDLGRKSEFANTIQYQTVKGVKYAVHYNELGYAFKAIKQ